MSHNYLTAEQLDAAVTRMVAEVQGSGGWNGKDRYFAKGEGLPAHIVEVTDRVVAGVQATP